MATTKLADGYLLTRPGSVEYLFFEVIPQDLYHETTGAPPNEKVTFNSQTIMVTASGNVVTISYPDGTVNHATLNGNTLTVTSETATLAFHAATGAQYVAALNRLNALVARDNAAAS